MLSKKSKKEDSAPPSKKELPPVVEEIYDTHTTGTMFAQKCDLFAIVKLNNGENALLANHRVWINDKPKFGGWRPLYLEYFKVLNVNARRVHGFKDFSYQISFVHTGMNHRNWRTRQFEYPQNMKDWMQPMMVTQTMDSELSVYRTRHG